jgi:protein-S-isoprenylcysteine O-methyltransferase Ste14
MKKTAIFAYGMIAYIIFFASFLYLIGFIGNYKVPKSIDSEPDSSNYILSILINISLISIFFLQHSFMARSIFKKWIIKFIDPAIERSTYVLISSILLFLIFFGWQPMTKVIWVLENRLFTIFFFIIYVCGWMIILFSSFMTDHFELFGLKQIYYKLKNKQLENSKFQINFFYKLVRHPMMLGFIIVFWATPNMSAGHFLFSITLSAYIYIAIKYLEEKDLEKELGKEYTEYKKSVPMILPFSLNFLKKRDSK